jgi:DNA-binding IclR family transcriptional regulator
MTEIQSLARGLKILDLLGHAQDDLSISLDQLPRLTAIVVETGKALSERMTFVR